MNAINYLKTLLTQTEPTDKNCANVILLLGGIVLGAVSIISAVCGMILVGMGDLEKSGALVPYIVLPAALAILALWAVKDRKEDSANGN